jgi:hypothetical protein
MAKIIFSFSNSRDAELAKTGNRVVSGIKGNSFFPDTTLVQALEKDLQEYQVALNNAADGGRTFISIKKDKRRILVATLTKVAFYVMQVSNGDKSMLLTTGFELAKETGTSTPLAGIDTIVVETSLPGEASVLVNAVKGARAYVHQYTLDPPSSTAVWVSETSAHRKHTFKGLQSVTAYWFRVIAIGLNGQQVISDPVPRMVQ